MGTVEQFLASGGKVERLAPRGLLARPKKECTPRTAPDADFVPIISNEELNKKYGKKSWFFYRESEAKNYLEKCIEQGKEAYLCRMRPKGFLVSTPQGGIQ